MPKIFLFLTIFFLSFGLTACSRQTAEEKGKEMADEKLGIVKGVGEALKQSGKQATETLAHGATNAVQGVGAGVDAAMAITFKLSPKVEQNGLKITRIQPGSVETAKGPVLSAYLTASKAASGRMTVFAYDNKNNELGRVTRDIRLDANGAGYEDFEFDARTKRDLIAYLNIDFAPAAVK